MDDDARPLRLPRFETAARIRPVDLVAPDAVEVDRAAPGDASSTPLPQPAPSVAAVAEAPAGAVALTLASGGVLLTGLLDAERGTVGLRVTTPAGTTEHRSRRHGRLDASTRAATDALAVTLTGVHLTALVRSRGAWTARARVDLRDLLDDERLTHDEAWLGGLTLGHEGAVGRLLAGGVGQLGLRDLRLVTHADGTAYSPGGLPLLAATSAGPGFFDTAHTSVWSLDPDRLELRHLSDVFFRRPDRPGVYADHATHLVRDGDAWLVATSTWGDFDPGRDDATVAVTLARTDADLLHGRHVLDTEALELPTDGFDSVGVWDPHLVRRDGGWLVGYVSASRWFRFHPVLAEGPSLDRLRLRAAATDRRATEGTTLAQVDGRWLVLASDGRDGRRGQRAAYPVFDLDLTQLGALDAPYPTNIPWPTLVPSARGRLLVGFDDTRHGGPLAGYGTHGDVVVAREV